MNSNEENKLEYAVLIEEYKSLRTEINSTLVSVRQALTLSFVGIGGLISLIPFIIEKQNPTLLLIPPIFFFGLLWNKLRYYMVISEIGLYIESVITPRIREIIKSGSEEDNIFPDLMSWDEKFKGICNVYGVRFSLIEASDSYISFFGVLSPIVGYFFLSHQISHHKNSLDLLLIIVNIFAFIYTALIYFLISNPAKLTRKVHYSSVNRETPPTNT